MAYESTNTGLDLFSVPPVQTSMEQGTWVESHPLATLTDNSPIEFNIVGNSDDYLDLTNTFLHIQCKVTKPNGENLTDEDVAVAPENLFLHSLFSEVDVSLNGVLISTSTNTYPYRAYIETLLNYDKETKDTQMALPMYYEDNQFPFSKDNHARGLEARRLRIKGSKTVDMVGRIHADIFSQEKYLLNKVDLRLRFIRSRDSFCLLAVPLKDGEPTPHYKVKIQHASLFVRKAKINPSIVLAHAKALQKATCKYPVKRVVTKVFSVPQGNHNCVQDNLFVNQRPNKLVIALVDSRAFNGHYESSPFEFKHYNINNLALYADAQQIPAKAFKPDFENEIYARAYHSIFTCSGSAWRNTSNAIKYKEYRKGFTIFCFDLSPSLTDGDIVEPLKTGSIRLEIGFGEPLPNPVHILTYGQFDGILEIDESRQVLTDFTT